MSILDKHSLITIIFLAIFPRITLLLASFSTGGILWWLGWIFCPHWLVAILSISYFESNPILTVCAFLIAINNSTKKENK